MSKRTGIMLATMFTEKLFNKMPKPVYVQPKIEGDRLRAVITTERVVTLFSSGGKKRISIPHIVAELEDAKIFRGVELDGEVYRHGMKHSEIRSRISRTKNVHPEYRDLEYHVFDIIDTKLREHNRHKILTSFFDHQRYFRYIKLVPTVSVRTLSEVQKYYKIFLKHGYEGIIIRNRLALYTKHKCVSLLKLKPRVSEYFKIIKVNLEYDLQGISKNTFGSFTCVTPEGTEFKVGTGPTAYQRNLIWGNKKIFIGEEVKIRFQGYTKIKNVPKLLSIDKQWLVEIQKLLTE